MKKRCRIIGGIVFFLALGVLGHTLMSIAQKEYHIITDPSALLELSSMSSVKNIIIDLRDKEDYELGHLEGSINIPFIDGSEVDLYLKSRHSTNKNIYLFCYSGKRAGAVFNYLSNKQYHHLNYISFGYDDFCDSVGDAYNPAIGSCDCTDW